MFLFCGFIFIASSENSEALSIYKLLLFMLWIFKILFVYLGIFSFKLGILLMEVLFR